jgi:hypothetical protein
VKFELKKEISRVEQRLRKLVYRKKQKQFSNMIQNLYTGTDLKKGGEEKGGKKLAHFVDGSGNKIHYFLSEGGREGVGTEKLGWMDGAGFDKGKNKGLAGQERG